MRRLFHRTSIDTSNQNRHIRCFSASLQPDKVCDIAIIGSGIMGLNAAYQIARRSSANTKIKIFEQAPGPGYGSSGSSSGILRHFYSLEPQIAFARDGTRCYKNWAEYLQSDDVTASFTKTGMLLLAPSSNTEAREHHLKFKKYGIDMTVVDKAMMEQRFPQINSDIGTFDNSGEHEHEYKSMNEDTFLLYEEDAGYFEPGQALMDLQNVLKTRYAENVSLHFHTAVQKIIHKGGKVKGLEISHKDQATDTVFCDTIINCSGPWYNQVVKDLDLDIKLTLSPVRIQVIYKECPELFTPDFLSKFGKENNVPIPIVTDCLSGVYMRPQVASQQILASTLREEDERDKWDPNVALPNGADPEVRTRYLNSVYHRLEPILKPTSAKVQSLSSFYTICEDDVQYVLGPTKLKGFVLCNGFSGHGFKCAPAVGSIIAQNVCGARIDGDTDVPIEFFSCYRAPHRLKVKNVLA